MTTGIALTTAVPPFSPTHRPATAPTPSPCLNCILLGSPASWSDTDLRSYLQSKQVLFSTSRTKKGSHAAFLTFATPADKAAAETVLNGARLGRRKLKLRDAAPAQRGGRDGSGVREPRVFKIAADIDIRDVVTPLWRVSYADQLKQKHGRVQAALAEIAVRVKKSDARAAPSWAGNAIPLIGIIRSPVTAAYRNKQEFTAGNDVDGAPCVGNCLGAYRDGIIAIAAPGDSVAHVSRAAAALAAGMTRYVATESKLPVWNKCVNAGFWRLLTVREGGRTTLLKGDDGREPRFVELDWRQWLVKDVCGGATAAETDAAATSTTEPPSDPAAGVASIPHADTLAVIIQIHPGASPDAATTDRELAALASALRDAAASVGAPRPSLAVQHHTGISNAAPADAPLVPCPGDGDDASANALAVVDDSLCGLTFRVSPSAFFQVNTAAAAVLYRLAVDWAAPAPGGVVYDVCCGTGTLGVCAAAVAAAQSAGDGAAPASTVLGVDIDAGAIANATENAAANGVTGARFVAGKAEDALAGLLSEGATTTTTTTDAVTIVDPPRAGLHPRVRAALRAAPSVHRIVYVSCNPASLAVDAADLCSPSASPYPPFLPVRAAAVDLFPHTAHVETVLLLERQKEGGVEGA